MSFTMLVGPSFYDPRTWTTNAPYRQRFLSTSPEQSQDSSKTANSSEPSTSQPSSQTSSKKVKFDGNLCYEQKPSALPWPRSVILKPNTLDTWFVHQGPTAPNSPANSHPCTPTSSSATNPCSSSSSVFTAPKPLIRSRRKRKMTSNTPPRVAGPSLHPSMGWSEETQRWLSRMMDSCETAAQKKFLVSILPTMLDRYTEQTVAAEELPSQDTNIHDDSRSEEMEVEASLLGDDEMTDMKSKNPNHKYQSDIMAALSSAFSTRVTPSSPTKRKVDFAAGGGGQEDLSPLSKRVKLERSDTAPNMESKWCTTLGVARQGSLLAPARQTLGRHASVFDLSELLTDGSASVPRLRPPQSENSISLIETTLPSDVLTPQRSPSANEVHAETWRKMNSTPFLLRTSSRTRLRGSPTSMHDRREVRI